MALPQRVYRHHIGHIILDVHQCSCTEINTNENMGLAPVHSNKCLTLQTSSLLCGMREICVTIKKLINGFFNFHIA